MVEIRPDALADYPDVLTPEVVAALHELAPLDDDRQAVMAARLARRARRAANARAHRVSRSGRTHRAHRDHGADARDGAFTGSDIPDDLQRQWIQGTGPGAKPDAPIDKSIRNVAYALLSGADGWMFDGEDALGQLSTMSLDNQRNLKLAIHRDAVFLKAAEEVAARDERLGAVVLRPADRRRLADAARLHDEDLPRARPAPRRPPRPARRRRAASRRRSSTGHSTS